MLALRWRARRAASRRNGQPTTNCTRVATISAARRHPVTVISAGQTIVTSANSAAGTAATTRRPQERRTAASVSVAAPPRWPAAGVRL
jgi:hypothetical protein